MFANVPIDKSLAFRTKTTELSFVLKPSPKKGIGVFATHRIKADTFLRLFPTPRARLVRHSQLTSNKLLKNFCERYGVERKEGFYTAPDFSRVDIGWYLNHSKKPNAYHDKRHRYFALRNIDAGEEITIDYNLL